MNQQDFDQLIAELGKTPGIEVPPKVYVDMAPEFVSYLEKKELTLRFPVQERYQNPMGMMQGGMIVAAMDNVIGPLSYLSGSPSVTIQINTTYIRPVQPQDKTITITASILSQSKSHLNFKAKAMSEDGKILVSCTATNYIL